MAENDARVDAPLLTESRDAPGVARLTMNRPQAFNALSEGLLDALTEALRRLAADPSVRVVVLAGAGKAFCAGHDLREMRAAPSHDYYRRLFDRCTRMMMAIQQMPQPVIARVHGIATAAGCQLVAMCDLAVAADDARFAVSGVNLGLFCSTPGVALSRNLHRKQAMEMLLTGDMIDAAGARERGLVNRVVPAGELDAEVARLAASICAKPAAAVAAGKGLFYRQLEMGIEAAYQLAGQTMACNMMDESALEGVQAFIDKRSPSWRAS
ncbi:MULTISPECIES: enoyl-CoA hydratase [Cupriavidus]|uniref:Enoyl-CoA hydratase domain-containing protein 3, mitochondrial n=1 Tax=Cupriavidus taiwanensis TaxID=164546 RepID=A0A375D1Q1_9BURK|nr:MULTISPECIES: enoyl-CoA hydratase [Cupriavidus]MEC3766778.1 enoyl-CoA hydratase [Cupriavidus sp. SS-3]SOY90085.1 putative Enoyl-CoA hydratase/isomerase [Cupriavidus taiwanensis]SOY91190.1 putative Enoyl-CoA hydratase/isomerase [Cupriavidus taiwanensis]SPD63844.1 Enoyl-CoA hydratase [Cupriavidus taiwanensis]